MPTYARPRSNSLFQVTYVRQALCSDQVISFLLGLPGYSSSALQVDDCVLADNRQGMATSTPHANQMQQDCQSLRACMTELDRH